MREEVLRSDAAMASAIATGAVAMTFVAMALLMPLPGHAAPPEPACQCTEPRPLLSPGSSETEADTRKSLTPHDQTAVMQAVHYALSEIGDGASYVWHRTHGRLSGVVQVNGTYKGTTGALCRRLNVMLTSGGETRKLTTHACRLPDRSWQLAPA
jgi:hypothetical protein